MSENHVGIIAARIEDDALRESSEEVVELPDRTVPCRLVVLFGDAFLAVGRFDRRGAAAGVLRFEEFPLALARFAVFRWIVVTSSAP